LLDFGKFSWPFSPEERSNVTDVQSKPQKHTKEKGEGKEESGGRKRLFSVLLTLENDK